MYKNLHKYTAVRSIMKFSLTSLLYHDLIFDCMCYRSMTRWQTTECHGYQTVRTSTNSVAVKWSSRQSVTIPLQVSTITWGGTGEGGQLH